MAARKSIVPQREARAVRSIAELPQEQIDEIEAATPEDWVDDDSGQAFPPFWKPGVGHWFRGIPLFRDETVDNFTRWHIEATLPLDGFRGNKDSREIVTIEKGEIFTVSGCKGLLLERYVGFEIQAIVTSVDELAPNEESEGLPRDFYRFRVKTSPQTNRQLKEVRAAVRAQLIETSKKKALDNMLAIAAGQAMGANGRTRTAAAPLTAGK